MSAILRATTVKKPLKDILSKSLPKKSEKQYNATYSEFCKFAEIPEMQEPTEEQVIQYMDYLRNEREFKASSMWTR